MLNQNEATCTYAVGKVTNPDGFETDLYEDCGQGIHCFATPTKALNLAGIW